MLSDKRQHPRKVFSSEVTFQVAGGARHEGRCHDVSLGGVFIETDSPLPYGTRVRVFMHLPGLRDESAIDAIVRWSKPTGMGVQFGVMGARETHALTQLLTGG
jgi:type IV pilus assembly protein PilZ